ncbi:MAG: hypothetical protein JNG83_00170 [Opitutaceae bacterium]|nr:hypothetical protein [Opitutaceae bacterium]
MHTFRGVRLAVGLALAAPASVVAEVPAARMTGRFHGISCEYSPGQEELARLLAERLAAHNARLAKAGGGPLPTEALSPAEMRKNRKRYLREIAGLLDQRKMSRAQDECYEAFLDHYEATIRTFERLREEYQAVSRLTVWPREELVRRLAGGELISGMRYDPVTRRGEATYLGSVTAQNDAWLKELSEKRRTLRQKYSLAVNNQDGVTRYSAGFGPRGAAADQTAGDGAGAARDASSALPVIVPADMQLLAPAAAAERLWARTDGPSVLGVLEYLDRMFRGLTRTDPKIAFIVLHETAEVGIVDRYIQSPDRRWWCDGVANYVAWRTLRDLHGEKVAREAYDQDALRVAFADLRDQVDLRAWPAVENEADAVKGTRLHEAHYVFATQAVFLMHERAGDDILPRLFREMNLTPRKQVTMATVEAAWRKLTGTELAALLADALAN